MHLRRLLIPTLLAALAVAPAASAASTDGRIGPAQRLTASGRLLEPAGRLTQLGNFPTGGAVSPDGRFLWAIDSGHGANSVSVVALDSGQVVQTLPLPGAYGAVAFAPDGRTAYVSGEPASTASPPPPGGPTKGDQGDVLHVFSVDPASGRAVEQEPITLPATSNGSGQRNSLPPVSKGWPAGLAVTPDGGRVVVALNQADRIAIVDRASGAATTVPVGAYPFDVAIAPDGARAYVSNEYDGTVSVVDLAAGRQLHAIGVGGDAGDRNAHPEGLALDARHRLLWVAVASRDAIVAIDLDTDRVVRRVSVAREQAIGTEPVAVSLSPDGATAYVADEGEDAIAVVSTGVSERARLLGRIPTADFPTDVHVFAGGRRLAWIAAKGFGAGPNPDFVFDGAKSPAGNVQTPYGAYVPDMLTGYAGVLPVPSAAALRGLTRAADRQVVPTDAPVRPPAGTPLRAGGPIEHVFYVVRENRTYDQVFGTDPRGDGDPSLELFDDNGVAGPTGGVTPNAHKLARMFPLLDHFYANSEVSVDGHIITAGGYAIDYVQRALHANYSGRGRAFDFGVYPVTFPPAGFVFDQASRQNVRFRNYGEQGAGNLPGLGDDGRPTYPQVVANTDSAYPGNAQIGCLRAPATPATCFRDSGVTGAAPAPAIAALSRFDTFAGQFRQQVASGTVPAFNYLILPNDHTNGTTPGVMTPKAMVADNDLGLGQIVDLISHSAIWDRSAIVVVEDDSQDGADHVDAHRMPAFVISPWARPGGTVVSTRYDQYSALRTAEMLAGLEPLSLNDALAVPMYDAFRNDGRPDVAGTRYDAVLPAQSLTEVNGQQSPAAGLSLQLPLEQLDLVPQAILDRILWLSVHGADSTPPPPGPDASPVEHQRAVTALRLMRRHGNVRSYLARTGGGD